MRVYPLHIAVLAMGLSSCFSGSSSTPTDAAPPQPSSAAESIFPHKSNWKDPTQHGTYIKDTLKNDTGKCTTCHDEDAASSTAKSGAPGCRSCHTVFPHTASGVTLETHGQHVLKNGRSACATQCHGTDLKGGLNDVACTKCHTSYPHESGWSTPGVHGPAAKGNLKLQCALCHGSDYNGGASMVSCLICHKGTYPHPTGWSSPDQHGAFVLQNGTGKCATQCHGVQLDGGLSGVSCNTCHTVWPHPKAGWLTLHGEGAQTIGISGCTGCHKDDATGGKTGVNCTQCHAALPAHQNADWLNGGHGKLVMQHPASLTDPKGCPLCHGAGLTGGKTPVSPMLKAVKGCASCHASYPTLHKSAANTPAWNSYGGHATWVLGQVDVSKGGTLDQINALISDCKLCHGDDWKGGTTGKSCYACHTSFPHNIGTTATSWLSKHGASANAENPKTGSCATVNCHGQKLEGSSFNGKKLAAACSDCHLQMPHQGAWPQTHGASAATKISTCTTCHGTTLKGKGTSPSCYQCHDNFPLHHRNADGSKNTQWKSVVGTNSHGTFVKAASGTTSKDKAQTLKCKTCHDSGNAGNPSPSCYSCHASFPHAAKPVTAGGITYSFMDNMWGGFTNGHGQYVVARAKLNNKPVTQQIQMECGTACHGTDLSGGTSKKSCTSCHTSYPHIANWVKAYDPADTKTPGGEHGLYALKNGPASCLTGCHGTDGSGGNSGIACTSCHNYPHKTDWKMGAIASEYPPHALAVLNTQNTATKNDDAFNDGNFGECAKCHGPVLDYLKNETYPFPDGGKTKITLDTGVSVKRCTACHIYPHQKIQDMQFVMKEWKKLHGISLIHWSYGPGLSIPADTCGTVEGKPGCHVSGPAVTIDWLINFDECNYCHK